MQANNSLCGRRCLALGWRCSNVTVFGAGESCASIGEMVSVTTSSTYQLIGREGSETFKGRRSWTSRTVWPAIVRSSCRGPSRAYRRVERLTKEHLVRGFMMEWIQLNSRRRNIQLSSRRRTIQLSSRRRTIQLNSRRRNIQLSSRRRGSS
jgi:hypothetical protein